MNKATRCVRIICNIESGDFMVHWPSGAIEFVGWWGVIKLIWMLVLNNKRVTLVDAKSGKEETL